MPDMFSVLHHAEELLPDLLAPHKESLWKSLYVDYHPPIVERLWTQIGEYRICLHRIHPCKPEEALFHPHPWPSAMRIVNGHYEMTVGYGSGTSAPPVAARFLLGRGAAYEMTDPNSWHAVRPLDAAPSLSVMVSGAPWRREITARHTPLRPLSQKEQSSLFLVFRQYYGESAVIY